MLMTVRAAGDHRHCLRLGGVTTSTITVPLVTVGVGLATVIRGRNPLTDGFGMIAFASLLPMLFVMGYGHDPF